MLNELEFEKLRNKCKEIIESLEYWLSRLIDEELKKSYGEDYLNYSDASSNCLIKKEIRDNANNRKTAQPERYARLIDATLLDDKIYIVCREDLYQKHFKDALHDAFELGSTQAKQLMEQIIPIRNKLYHDNPISVREAEKVTCYCHDIIDSIKSFYEKMKKGSEYNVPLIIKIADSYGNIFHSSQIWRNNTGIGLCRTNTNLRPGDKLSLEVTVDESFASSDYNIKWSYHNMKKASYTETGNKIVIELQDIHVKNEFMISCTITSNNSWHRCGDYDDLVGIIYKVLPPL